VQRANSGRAGKSPSRHRYALAQSSAVPSPPSRRAAATFW